MGSQTINLLDESASSSAANRFTLGGDVAIGAKQAILLRYDGTASRWYALARPAAVSTGQLLSANNLSDLASAATARTNLGVRDVLTANRTYYVRTDGSNSNNGLANTSGGAFLTIQKAVDTVAALDIAGFTVTIQVGDGTYTGAISLKTIPGFSSPGCLVIKGNNTTPANVLISTTNAHAFLADGISSVWDIKDLKITTATAGDCLVANGGSILRFGNTNFGACAGAHIRAQNKGGVQVLSSYAISGGAIFHAVATVSGYASIGSYTVSGSGSLSFSTFCQAELGSVVYAATMTFSGTGSFTGTRYSVTTNSVIHTNGGGASYFPGSTAGSTSTGGQYT